MPESKTVISIDYRDRETAIAVQKSIGPDNLDLPDGMHIFLAVKDSVLEIEVHTDRSVGSLVSTLDDLLSCVQAAEKALGEL